MTRPHRLMRAAALLITGGCLMQFLGCAAGLLPAFVSLGESVGLSLLFGGWVP